jgi:tetratricopeptide (TPR) repeat protein
VDLEVLEKNNKVKLDMKFTFWFMYCFFFLFGAYDLKAQKNKLFDDRLFSKLLIQATGEKISGDLYSADSLYKKCLEINPNSGVVNYELSGVYRNLNNLEKALEYANKSVDLSSENEWYLANLALLYKDLGNHKKSAEFFLKLTEKNPDKISYLFSLTEELLENNQYKKAIKILNKIEINIGINEELTIEKHRIYVYLKKNKSAIEELKKLIAKQPDNLRSIGLLAEFYENINKPDEALKLLSNMMQIDSSNGLVRLSLFQHYYKQQKFNQGYKELLHVMTSKEVDENLKKQILLQIAYDSNSPFSVEEIYLLSKKFLIEHSQNSDVLLLVGNLHMMSRKVDSACYYLRESLKYDPSEIEVWIQLLSSSLSINKFKIVVQDAKNAIESHPNQPFPYLALGIALSNLGKLNEAIQILIKGKDFVIEDEILESDFDHEIGNLFYKNKNIESSFEYFEKSIDLNPNNYILLNNYSYYLSLEKINLKRAEELILKVIDKFPNVATYIDTYGWILFQQGKYNLAEKELFKAVMYSNDQSGEILEHYGDVLFQLENKDGALLFWEKAEKTGQHSNQLIQKINANKFIK